MLNYVDIFPKIESSLHVTIGHYFQLTFIVFIFLIEGQLLYRILLFSVKYQHEPVISVHMSPLSE